MENKEFDVVIQIGKDNDKYKVTYINNQTKNTEIVEMKSEDLVAYFRWVIGIQAKTKQRVKIII